LQQPVSSQQHVVDWLAVGAKGNARGHQLVHMRDSKLSFIMGGSKMVELKKNRGQLSCSKTVSKSLIIGLEGLHSHFI